MNMTNYLRNILLASLMVTGFALGGLLAPAPSVAALACGTDDIPGADYNKPACKVNKGINATGANSDDNKTCTAEDGSKRACTLGDRVQQVINVLLFIIGVISVIMIIIGGIKYVLSNGDSNAVKSAKDTILYAVIGLVIALLAYAIVNFVVNAFAK